MGNNQTNEINDVSNQTNKNTIYKNDPLIIKNYIEEYYKEYDIDTGDFKDRARSLKNYTEFENTTVYEIAENNYVNDYKALYERYERKIDVLKANLKNNIKNQERFMTESQLFTSRAKTEEFEKCKSENRRMRSLGVRWKLNEMRMEKNGERLSKYEECNIELNH
tara:strand:- start:3196 stop:3690 length:495 start_codon:yes stop_codon:yes gene_type:complete